MYIKEMITVNLLVEMYPSFLLDSTLAMMNLKN